MDESSVSGFALFCLSGFITTWTKKGSRKMCTVLGIEKCSFPMEQVVESLARTRSRGPDDERIYQAGEGLLGFQRLTIMGLSEKGMQPFKLGNSMVVCNGEIYGFRPVKTELIARGYRFESNSDCEVLLPLYKEYGTAMFRMLDAEFAMVLYDGDKDQFVAARDPIGIRPLYYCIQKDGSYIFGSEPKNLISLADGQILPFPPGCYYADGKITRYCDISAAGPSTGSDPEAAAQNIKKLLVRAVAKRMDSDTPVGFLLSGGLDSSLVCSIAARLTDKPIRTYAIGMDVNPIDLKYARETAEYLGADHTEVIMTKDEVLSSLRDIIKLLGTFDITTIRASIGMYLCCKYIHEHSDIRVILTGEVSDELFGYKYTDFAPSPEEFQKEAAKRVRELNCYDVLRADRCISVNSLEARVPFGDLDFVHYVMSLDPSIKMNIYHKGKYLLRHAFEQGGWLPESILMREKAAFSDAVGHSMVDDLKAYAETMYTDEEFEKRRQMYDWCRPFTKESLLYREIFEEFYPGQAKMTPAFWMPNPTWPGCKVDDPSARVLANYGTSGI